MSMPDEFFIGYESTMPPGIRRTVRRAVVAAIGGSIVLAIAVTSVQLPLAEAHFAYGRPRMFRGWLSSTPVPTLHVTEGDRLIRYWLVAPGKFGPGRVLEGVPDGPVELDGALITREHWHMVEVVPGSVRSVSGDGPPHASRVLEARSVRLRGEVVDAKCFLGVMNPGQHTAHRDCAVRCLSGGIPTMFSYADERGAVHLALMIDSTGTAPPTWRALAGTSVEIAGSLVMDGDVEVLVVEAAW
jgi:hypothetical protein